jgi:sortase A
VETIDSTPMPRTPSLARRARRVAANVVLVIGVGVLVWTFVVWQWNDPFTSLYTRWEQHKLAATHDEIVKRYTPKRSIPPSATPQEEAAQIARDASTFRAGAGKGAPIGRIIVPRLHLNMLLINGTDTASLRRGPGRDKRTYMPGQGQLIYIAGHRTTYLAPFSAIDTMRPGDRVTLAMPYGTFDYEVTGHRIVDASDLSVLKSNGTEMVALQACHPRFFATQRYIAWAKPVRVKPVKGRPYTPQD